MYWFWFWLMLVVAGTSPVSLVATALPTMSAEEGCANAPTLSEDITLVLDQYEPVFSRDSWALTIADNSDEAHVLFTWFPRNGAASVASVSLMMWPCGVTEKELDAYYSDKTLDVLASNWDERELLGRCIVDGVRIADFALSRQDGDYIARFWIHQVSKTRVLEGQLTLPAEYISLQKDYAEMLYPDTPACK